MTRTFKLALFSLCSLMLLISSCSSDNTPAIPEVGNFGEIKFDREKFGAGQTVTASCQLPSTSSDISDLVYTWSVNGNELGSTKVENGISYFTFIVPSLDTNTNEADYKVELKASTSYTEAKLPATATATIKVQRPDVYLSFFGDSQELTIKNVPGLGESNNGYYATLKDYLRNNSLNVVCQYNFTDNKLARVEEMREMIPKTSNVQWYSYLKNFNGLIKSTIDYYKITTIDQSYISLSGEISKEYAYDSTDNTYLGEVAESILQNQGKIIIYGHNNNTELAISAVIVEKSESPTGYLVNCRYIYTPKQ